MVKFAEFHPLHLPLDFHSAQNFIASLQSHLLSLNCCEKSKIKRALCFAQSPRPELVSGETISVEKLFRGPVANRFTLMRIGFVSKQGRGRTGFVSKQDRGPVNDANPFDTRII